MFGTTILAVGVMLGFLVPPLSAALRASLARPKNSVLFPFIAIVVTPVVVGNIPIFAFIPDAIVAAAVLTLASPPSS